MSEVRGSNSWRDEFASLVEDTGIRFVADPISMSTTSFETTTTEYVSAELRNEEPEQTESLKDQFKGFAMAWGEILLELAKGFKDIVQQTLLHENSYVLRKLRKPCARVSSKFRYLNEFLPEDRDPVHSWSVVFFVIILAMAALSFNSMHDNSTRTMRKVQIHPPSATLIVLPDGRQLAYQEQGVLADRARFCIIAPHSFLSSRLAGIPGIKTSLLEEFGVRLITYDLPGFGESDPHPTRNLNSSAMDIQFLADALGITEKFWVVAHSSGTVHAWAALRYIPHRVAGAALFAPMINPYDREMTKEEMKGTWEKWLPRRKFMYLLARRFPRFLSQFYSRSFLSGKHDRIDKRLYMSLGKKDEILIEDPMFEEHWHRDVEEAIRQRSAEPFIEEAVLQVSHWGFTLSDLQVQRKCQSRGILPWLRSMYSQAECELTGFSGPIHIWQGMNDMMFPSSMSDTIVRVLPGATVHMLPNEGHFSYFFFCDECHRSIFFTLFGSPQGLLYNKVEAEMDRTSTTEYVEEASSTGASKD